MKIILDNSPAKLAIVTPHGAVEIEVWPGDDNVGSTVVNTRTAAGNYDQCLRGDESTRIVFKKKQL